MTHTLIFDLDGTLVDTAPDLLAAANAVLAARDRPAIDPVTLHHMIGFGARSLIAQAFTATGEEARAEEMPALEAIFLDHYRAHLADFSRPFPGVEETLTRLKAEDGAPMEIGGAMLAGAAMRAGLIDEYQVVTHPVLVGGGTPFFSALDSWVNLRLVETRTFADGVTLSHYESRR